MTTHRGPHHNGTCPFQMDAEYPLSAEASICHCVTCVTRGNARLESLQEDFKQTAYLTILEETPKYDPGHPSGASFITFIKSKVCCGLWKQRCEELKYHPCSQDEEGQEFSPQVGRNFLSTAAAPQAPNLLTAHLHAEACRQESLEDEVIRKSEVESFLEHLPRLLARLTETERTVVRLKYFEDVPGVAIAKALGVSPGRVSQLTKSAIAKLRKAYAQHADTPPGTAARPETTSYDSANLNCST